MISKKENKKINTITLVTIGLVTMAVIVFASVAIPSLKKLKANSTRAAIAAYNLKAGEKYISDTDIAYKKLVANQEAVALLNTASPTSPDVAGAMTQLDSMVSDSGLTLNTLSPSQSDTGATKVNILVSGAYENLQKFLTSLENNLRPFLIDNVTITAYEDGDQMLTAGNYSVELSFTGGPARLDEPSRSGGQAASNKSTQSQTTTVSSGGKQ